jgi:YggT family protein
VLATLICLALTVYVWVLFAAIVASFALGFGWRPAPQLRPLLDALRAATEPLLGLLRRYIPPIGGFDFSPLIVFLVIRIIRGYLC